MTNWVLPFGRQQLNSYQLTLSILKTSPDRNNNLIVLINSPSTLQDYPNLFHVVDNIFTTWRSWWFWLYSMLTCIFLLYPAFVIGFLSDHVSLSCMLWKKANNKCIFLLYPAFVIGFLFDHAWYKKMHLYLAWSERKPITNAGYRRKMHVSIEYSQNHQDRQVVNMLSMTWNKLE